MKKLISLLILMPFLAQAAVTVTVNGTSHTIPQTNERGWGANVTAWIQAISANTLQPSGGTFTLTADTDLGASFGLKSSYYKSRGTNLSTSGVFRLANTESIGWRNAANGANLLLSVNASDQLTFNGNAFLGTAALTASRALASDASGLVSATSVTATELGYVSGVTSAIQTQLDAAATDSDLSAHEADTTSIHGITDTANLVTLAGTQTLTNKTINADGTGNSITNIENADIKAAAAIALNKLAAATASRALVSDGSGFISPATTTATEIGYVNGVTSAIQTQLDAKTAKATLTTKGDLYVATGSGVVTRIGVGSNSQVLTADSGETPGVKWATPTAATVVNPESGGVRIVSAYITSVGTPTVADEDGDWISSLTDNGVGDVTINITASTFSTAPRCIVQVQSANTRIVRITTATTTSAVRFLNFKQSDGTASHENNYVICVGGA